MDAQMATFENVVVAATGKPHTPDALTVAFLRTDDGLLKQRIEQAIDQFVQTGIWPQLDEKQALHLTHRAFSARGLLLAFLGGQMAQEKVRPQIPDPTDKARFIRWLLIDLWNAGGASYLEALTNSFLASHSDFKGS